MYGAQVGAADSKVLHYLLNIATLFVRVPSREFFRTPMPPNASVGEPGGGDKGPAAGAATTTVADLVEHQEEKKIPYLIQASVNEPGLGLLSWWKS